MDPATLAAIIAAVLGAGGVGAFATLRKAGKEAEAIATRTLIAVNEELRREMGRLRAQHAEDLARRDTEIAMLRERIAVLEARQTVSEQRYDDLQHP